MFLSRNLGFFSVFFSWKSSYVIHSFNWKSCFFSGLGKKTAFSFIQSVLPKNVKKMNFSGEIKKYGPFDLTKKGVSPLWHAYSLCCKVNRSQNNCTRDLGEFKNDFYTIVTNTTNGDSKKIVSIGLLTMKKMFQLSSRKNSWYQPRRINSNYPQL